MRWVVRGQNSQQESGEDRRYEKHLAEGRADADADKRQDSTLAGPVTGSGGGPRSAPADDDQRTHEDRANDPRLGEHRQVDVMGIVELRKLNHEGAVVARVDEIRRELAGEVQIANAEDRVRVENAQRAAPQIE